ncbi:hypothetical protein HPB50_009891 [Hyalomma asiaticum]|uniref:Uncharacterized protein n=1 Tax=Hyalomma asiaticum TaxID=266040 RepID=A0ACB7RHI9_HYAAI|nr:hypothetical protein HPB50_009891 [Hyalomma asiaticum]
MRARWYGARFVIGYTVRPSAIAQRRRRHPRVGLSFVTVPPMPAASRSGARVMLVRVCLAGEASTYSSGVRANEVKDVRRIVPGGAVLSPLQSPPSRR